MGSSLEERLPEGVVGRQDARLARQADAALAATPVDAVKGERPRAVARHLGAELAEQLGAHGVVKAGPRLPKLHEQLGVAPVGAQVVGAVIVVGDGGHEVLGAQRHARLARRVAAALLVALGEGHGLGLVEDHHHVRGCLNGLVDLVGQDGHVPAKCVDLLGDGIHHDVAVQHREGLRALHANERAHARELLDILKRASKVLHRQRLHAVRPAGQPHPDRANGVGA